MKDLPQRRSIRLINFDYSQQGYYFVTICTYNREYLFGNIIDGKMILHDYGKMLDETIRQTPEIRKNIQIDIYQIMPNHIHLILVITQRVGAYCNTPLRSDNLPRQFKSPSQTLGAIVRGIKSVTARQIRLKMGNPQFPVWQRNFYERIIRNEIELLKIREYIKTNPKIWERDRNNLNADLK